MVCQTPDDKLTKLLVNPLCQYAFGSGLEPRDWDNSIVQDVSSSLLRCVVNKLIDSYH